MVLADAVPLRQAVKTAAATAVTAARRGITATLSDSFIAATELTSRRSRFTEICPLEFAAAPDSQRSVAPYDANSIKANKKKTIREGLAFLVATVDVWFSFAFFNIGRQGVILSHSAGGAGACSLCQLLAAALAFRGDWTGPCGLLVILKAAGPTLTRRRGDGAGGLEPGEEPAGPAAPRLPTAEAFTRLIAGSRSAAVRPVRSSCLAATRRVTLAGPPAAHVGGTGARQPRPRSDARCPRR